MNYIKEYYKKITNGDIKVSRKVRIVYEKLVKDIDNPRTVKIYNEDDEDFEEHKYVFELKYNGRNYTLHAFSDITFEDETEEIDLWIHYSSAISINQNWNIKESNNEEVD